MNEETQIEQKFGRQHPFRVPEGYFDTLEREVMARLPEDEGRVVALKPNRRWKIAAAVAVAAAFLVLLLNVNTVGTNLSAEGNASGIAAVYGQNSLYADDIDEMADYAMMDVGDMYCYVVDNN